MLAFDRLGSWLNIHLLPDRKAQLHLFLAINMFLAMTMFLGVNMFLSMNMFTAIEMA